MTASCEFLREHLAVAQHPSILKPVWYLAKRSRRSEFATAAAVVEGKSVLAQGLHDLPGFDIVFRRGLEIESHIDHRPGTLWANDLSRDMMQSFSHLPSRFIAIFPLPVLESLPALETGKVV